VASPASGVSASSAIERIASAPKRVRAALIADLPTSRRIAFAPRYAMPSVTTRSTSSVLMPR